MMNNTTENAKILDTITKLLAKAEGTTNPAEAEAFFAKASDLMMRWAIDDAMLNDHRGRNEDKIVQVFIPVRGSYFQAHMDLASQVGAGFGFRRVRTGAGRGANNEFDVTVKERLAWVGYESDITRAQLLYTSLLVQLERALKTHVKTTPGFSRLSAMDKFKSRRSFMIGFADVVGRRLKESMRVAKDTTPGSGLVLASRAHAIDEKMSELYPRLGKARRSNLQITGHGYHAGKQAGERAGLATTAVGGAPKAIGR